VKIAWLASARRSLRQQLVYIAANNPAAARRVRQRIHEAVRNLARFPESGRTGEFVGTRELVVSGLPYMVVYRVCDDRVEILRLLHTSMNWSGAMN
jgi:toxin ParE1/3/4